VQLKGISSAFAFFTEKHTPGAVSVQGKISETQQGWHRSSSDPFRARNGTSA
jgi:hypothetical protein